MAGHIILAYINKQDKVMQVTTNFNIGNVITAPASAFPLVEDKALLTGTIETISIEIEQLDGVVCFVVYTLDTGLQVPQMHAAAVCPTCNGDGVCSVKEGDTCKTVTCDCQPQDVLADILSDYE